MATTQQLPAVIERHAAAVRATNAPALPALYPPDGRVYDPAGARPIAGRAAIRELFVGLLTEPRDAEISTIAVSGHLVAVHFRATLTGRRPCDTIDTVTFKDQGQITAMRAYAT